MEGEASSEVTLMVHLRCDEDLDAAVSGWEEGYQQSTVSKQSSERTGGAQWQELGKNGARGPVLVAGMVGGRSFRGVANEVCTCQRRHLWDVQRKLFVRQWDV